MLENSQRIDQMYQDQEFQDQLPQTSSRFIHRLPTYHCSSAVSQKRKTFCASRHDSERIVTLTHFGHRYAGSRIQTELLKCRSPKENKALFKFLFHAIYPSKRRLKRTSSPQHPLKEEKCLKVQCQLASVS